jgi:hypothetical protein
MHLDCVTEQGSGVGGGYALVVHPEGQRVPHAVEPDYRHTAARHSCRYRSEYHSGRALGQPEPVAVAVEDRRECSSVGHRSTKTWRAACSVP